MHVCLCSAAFRNKRPNIYPLPLLYVCPRETPYLYFILPGSFSTLVAERRRSPSALLFALCPCRAGPAPPQAAGRRTLPPSRVAAATGLLAGGWPADSSPERRRGEEEHGTGSTIRW